MTLAVLVVAALSALNLRGVRESGLAFAVPTYLFIGVILTMIGYGMFRIFVLDQPVRAESAGFTLNAEHTFTGFALVFLFVRAFSSGCAALTGVEAIANLTGVRHQSPQAIVLRDGKPVYHASHYDIEATHIEESIAC